jgi:hypothetical protein
MNVAEEFEARGIYVQKASWQETMLASRTRLIRLLGDENRNLRGVELGPWHSDGQPNIRRFEDLSLAHAETNVPKGNSYWNKREEWIDGRIHFMDKSSWTTYLGRTITAPKAVTVAAYLGADDGAKVWLNGREIFAAEHLGVRRRHLCKIPLALKAGENQLVVAIFRDKSWASGFYFSVHNDFAFRLWDRIEKDFPVQWDWAEQDGGEALRAWFGDDSHAEIEKKMIRKVLEELGADAGDLQNQFDGLARSEVRPDSRDWLDLYVSACERRRVTRLKPLLARFPRIVFTKHHNIGGTHYAYTEAQSDAQRERCFNPGAGLHILEMNGAYGAVHTLLDDPTGFIRDPDVSLDGRKILFSWKKSDRRDDFHLYEIDAISGKSRQLTFGLGFADYEGAYLPDGDIVFNSTRCVQTVDCWWTEVSNLYTCDKDGDFLRRLCFDQVHTNYPTVMYDGRVIYTRWEYNDRGHGMVQPLFQMNPDGTGQSEFYGNNSWFPTSILHARGIPNTQKVLAIAGGHHARQSGKLILVDPAKGRQENAGVQLIAPIRETRAERIDPYGQFGEQFQYPYPVGETEFLVTYDPVGWSRAWYGQRLLFSGNYYFQSVNTGRIYEEPPLLRFKIYFMTADGQRELLVADPNISCNQPVPLAARKVHIRPDAVDYNRQAGVYYLKDIYSGPGLNGLARGSIKKLRVIALEFRAAGIGENVNRGPAAGAIVSTPISVGNGSWDVKVVLGDARVYEDGSACFFVPARTPVYFQALNEKGHAVQTMRSWSTLQPGESFSCVGCHDSKNRVPSASGKITLAAQAGPQTLTPFYGPARGFSFLREIQPILDRHCIGCHNDRTAQVSLLAEANREPIAAATPKESENPKNSFSLLGTLNAEFRAGRKWTDSYLALTHAYVNPRGNPHIMGDWDNDMVNWVSPQSIPPMIPALDKGAARSRLIGLLEAGHKDVRLSREEMDKIACWIDLLVPYCGDYAEANTWGEPGMVKHNRWIENDKWSQSDPAKRYAHFLAKRKRMERIERKNIQALLAGQ